jgi:S-adenosylmethionine:tRNA ribosyltransferase-isomerase
LIALDRRHDFTLPAELEAREPPEARGLARDQVRLLVSSAGGASIDHTRFADLPRYLNPGDLLVANDSATLPAALAAHSAECGDLPLHLSMRLPGGLWVVEPRTKELGAARALSLPAGGMARLLGRYADSRRLWLARLALPRPWLEYLQEHGRPIAYSYVPASWPVEAYQTIYAAEPGSAEMASAGRAFSHDIIARLADRGVGFATLTLHTGVSSLEEHEPPYEEPYVVPPACAVAVAQTRQAGGRVIAVGTTVVRALETVADLDGRVTPRRGWTELVITPDRGVRVVDGLITGFHEPQATHLAMLEAIAGRGHLERAYQAALEHGYLWHEFGDLHLIL